MSNVTNFKRISCSICIHCIKWVPVIFILGVVGWSYYAYVIKLCIFTVGSYAEKTVYLILYHMLLLLFLWSYYQTVMTPIVRVSKQFRLSPEDEQRLSSASGPFDRFGLNSEDWILEEIVTKNRLPVHTRRRGYRRFCRRCRLIKPDRCHHCLACNTCVLKKDHHCTWMNNCIGFTNYKFFLLFAGYAISYCIYITLTSLHYFIGFWRDGPEGATDVHIVALFFVSTILGISMIPLFGFHCFLVLRNQSTYEFIWPPKFTYGRNKYAYGTTRYANFCEVFGDAKLKWLLPVFTSLGDGVEFQVSPLLIQHNGANTNTSDPATSDPATSDTGSSTSLGNGAGHDEQDAQGLMAPLRWQNDQQNSAQKYASGQSADPEAALDVRLLEEYCHHGRCGLTASSSEPARMTASSSEPAIYLSTVQ